MPLALGVKVKLYDCQLVVRATAGAWKFVPFTATPITRLLAARARKLIVTGVPPATARFI